MPAKQHAFRRERVEVRRLEAGMAQGREAFRAPLVEGDQENVTQGRLLVL